MDYPRARRSSHADVRHGVTVSDPYRWLEDATGDETRSWVDAENALTRRMLDGPARDALVARLTRLFDYPRLTAPLRRGTRYFFNWNSGLLDQAILHVRDTFDGGARVLIDPNTLSPDGTVALTGVFPSEDGRWLAYGVSRSGSDRQEFFVRDVERDRDLEDRLLWIKFASIAWLPDSSGFYYLRFPAAGTVAPEDEQYSGRIYRHTLGRAQGDDPLVFEHPQKEVVPLVDLTHDGRTVVVTAQRGASDDAEVTLIDAETGVQRPLFTGFDAAYTFAGDVNRDLLFLTTRDAPMGRVIAADRDTLRVREVVAESAHRLSRAAVADSRLVLNYLRNASDAIELMALDGAPRGSIPLPGIGTVPTLDVRRDADEVVFTYTSFTTAPAAYRWTAARGTEPFHPPSGGRGSASADRDAYITRQVWYPSKDGTPVSMFLVHRSDIAADGQRPVLLSGYGGFNINRTPQFDPALLVLLEQGGVFALANLRGGGEYGEAWHRAGMRERKQNVFDDFMAAAEYLVQEGLTTPARLAIEGGSNGGLLVAAVMVQRPDLFGAVICRVPVADMLRYHRFTVGRFWIPEYGCADDPHDFEFLLRYSPLQNVREGVRYPPTLVMTADTDDRVDPGMAKKFAATLQALGTGGPFLLRVERKAGHGLGKPVSKLIEEDADIFTFLQRQGIGC